MVIVSTHSPYPNTFRFFLVLASGRIAQHFQFGVAFEGFFRLFIEPPGGVLVQVVFSALGAYLGGYFLDEEHG